MAADRFLDTEGLRHLWSKIKSMFVSHSEFEQAEQDLESKILIPNFDNMTPVKTIELDVAATSYYQLFSRANTDISTLMTEVDDIVLFRITVTGTNIYSVYDCYIQFRAGLVYPLVAINSDTYSVSAATSGLCYIRFPYPKTLNSGYDWLCDFRAYNATARHIKVEVFATTDNVHWFETLTATTYNSTYQTDSSYSLYDRRGLVIIGTLYTNALTASAANYITNFHPKYVNSGIIKAGEELVSGYLLYVNNGYAFRISNKNNSIDADYGINATGTSYSANANIAYNQLRPQQSLTFTTDTNLTYDPIAIGDKVYLRCRLVGDKIYSDGHLSTKMTAGYTWYMLGGAYSTTQVSLNTLGSFFITLDENGMISHINGKPSQAALMNGSYKRRFCGEIESDVSANAKLEFVEGRSLVFNQIIQNGDFSDGTTGWAATQSATLSVSDGVLSAYRSNGQAYFGAVTTGNNGKVYKDHKYFYSIYAKASKAMNAYTPYLDGTYVTKQQAVAVPFQLTTEWQRFVGIVISIKDGQCLFGIRNYTSNVGEATIYMKNAMMIDLTKMFGAGNEPQDTELLKQMFPLDYYDYNLDGTLLGGTQTGFKSEDGQGTALTNLSMPITTLTGKPTGSSTSEVMFPDGLLGIGDVRDEIDFENGKAYKRVGWKAYSSGDANSVTMLTDETNTSYVLQNEVEYTLDTVPTVEYETERGGSEQWLPVNTSVPTVAPICCISGYGSNVLVELDKKADKVVGAVSGNFAGLDETGNLTDSGYSISDLENSINGQKVWFNCWTCEYGVHPYSLFSFAMNPNKNGLCLTPFTTTGGTGNKRPVTTYWFPIGSNIYYHNSSEQAGQAGALNSGYTSFREVDVRYSAITGGNISLGSSINASTYFYTTSVFLRVLISGEYWQPYHESGSTTEILVSIDQLVAGNYYIYLGKLSAETTDGFHYILQLEDNNPLYYFDGNDLIMYTKRGNIPSGGTTRQFLAKRSNSDYDVEWIGPAAAFITAYDYQNHRVTISDGTHSQEYQLTPYYPIPDYYIGWEYGTKREFASMSGSHLANNATPYMKANNTSYQNECLDTIFYVMFKSSSAPTSGSLLSGDGVNSNKLLSQITAAEFLAGGNCPHNDVTIGETTYKVYALMNVYLADGDNTITVNFN